MDRRGLVVTALVVVLVGVTPVSASVGEVVSDSTEMDTVNGPTGSGSQADVETGDAPMAAAGDYDMPVTFTYRALPDRENAIEATVAVEDTSGVGEISVNLYEGMTATGADGFERDGEYHVWDGTTDRPTLTYRWNLEEADLGTHYEWGAITVANTPAVDGKPAGELGYMTTQPELTVAGNGTVADEIVVVGNYEEYERSADDQRIRLVVPEGVEPRQSPETTVDVLANASDSLSVDSDEDVAHGVVTPDSTKYRSDAGFYVAEDASTTEAIRAYVTTQRNFSYTDDGWWMYTALPDYYGTQLAVANGDVGYGPFAKMLSGGDSGAELAEIDRRIRRATDGEQTLQDVFRKLNGQRAITSENFTAAVRSVSNDSVAETADEYVTGTSDPPTEWNDGAYERAYGYEPANVSTGAPALVASGPSWNRSLATDDRPVVVGQTETLTARTGVENTGGVAGRFTLTPQITSEGDSATVRLSETGFVSPGETRNATVAHQFGDTGRYTFRQGYDRAEIRVVPMEPTATTSSIDAPETVTAGESATVSATISNDDETLSRTAVPVRVNGTLVANRTVFVGPSSNETVSFTVPANSTGTYPLSVGDRETTMTVVADQSGGGEASGDGSVSDAVGPAFGVMTGVVALLAGSTLLARRR